MSKLQPCKTCEQTVAIDARVCPHCGVRDPAPGDVSFGWSVFRVLFWAAVVLIPLLWWMYYAVGPGGVRLEFPH